MSHVFFSHDMCACVDSYGCDCDLSMFVVLENSKFECWKEPSMDNKNSQCYLSALQKHLLPLCVGCGTWLSSKFWGLVLAMCIPQEERTPIHAGGCSREFPAPPPQTLQGSRKENHPQLGGSGASAPKAKNRW